MGKLTETNVAYIAALHDYTKSVEEAMRDHSEKMESERDFWQAEAKRLKIDNDLLARTVDALLKPKRRIAEI